MLLRFIPCELQFHGRQKFHLQGMSLQSSSSCRSIANKTCQMHFSELTLQVIISSLMHFFCFSIHKWSNILKDISPIFS